VGGMPGFTAQSAHQSTMGGQGKAAHEDRLPDGQSTAAWHVYTVLVEPGAITWSIDDREVFRVDEQQKPWLRSVFDHPLNIRLNLQVDGAMPAYYQRPVTPETVFPAQFVVDWVRVYQFG
jgi:beta-glucanase (GH16 family)